MEAADSDYDVIGKAMERVPGTGGSGVRNTRGEHDMDA